MRLPVPRMSTVVFLIVVLLLLKVLVIWLEPRMAFFPVRGILRRRRP